MEWAAFPSKATQSPLVKSSVWKIFILPLELQMADVYTSVATNSQTNTPQLIQQYTSFRHTGKLLPTYL